MTVGVVIPCRNEERWLPQLLDALAAQTRQPDDVVIVDDRSGDGTAVAAEAWKHEHADFSARLVSGPGRGIATAVRAGVAALATDCVVRLDGHSRPASDYIERATSLLQDVNVGIAGGVWVIEPGAATRQAEAIAVAMAHPLGSGGASYRSRSSTEPADVDTVPFGCFRRSIWQDLGGLDEQLGSNEDYEFNYRARQRGLRVVLDPQMRCEYFARTTIGALGKQYWRYGWWKARMLLKHPRSLRWRQSLPALLAPALAVLLVAGIGTGDLRCWLALAAYPVAMVVGGAHAAAVRRTWATIAWLPLVFATMHIAWSTGFWTSLMSAAVDAPRAGEDGVKQDKGA